MQCVNAPLSYTCRSVVGTLAGNAVFLEGADLRGAKTMYYNNGDADQAYPGIKSE